MQNLIDPDLISRSDGPPHHLFDEWRKNRIHFNPPVSDYQPAAPNFLMEKGFWVITEHKDVSEISRNWKDFSCREQSVLIWEPADTETLETHRAGLMSMDPPDHLQVRRLLMSHFTASMTSSLEPSIANLATEIVDEISELGQCEFVFDVASKLPVYTFCELMGIPSKDRLKIAELGNNTVDLENPNIDHGAVQMELFTYASELASEKLRNPDGSLMSALANAQLDGKPVDPMIINSFFVTMAVAGHETTRSTASHFIKLMSEHPDQREILLTDIEGHIDNAIDEVLRYSPPVIQFKRTCMRETTFGDQTIQAGDKVYVSYPAANRDPAVFENPHKFDILRDNAKDHLSFGTGPHVCIAARLARLQLQYLLSEIYTRLPNIRLSGDVTRMRSIWHDAIVSMPVTF